MRLLEEIHEILNRRPGEATYTEAVESLPYAHMMLDSLRTAVLRLAYEIEALNPAGRGDYAPDATGGATDSR